MNPITIANAIANAVVVGAVFDVSLRVFGRPDHPIHKHKSALFARKFVSSIVICGALANLVYLSTPGWTEVLLNIGFAGNYLFSSFYDRINFSKTKDAKPKPPAKRKKPLQQSKRKPHGTSN